MSKSRGRLLGELREAIRTAHREGLSMREIFGQLRAELGRWWCPDCGEPCSSCCDACGWAWHGGGDDPLLPSRRTSEQIQAEMERRARQ